MALDAQFKFCKKKNLLCALESWYMNLLKFKIIY